MKRIKLDLGFCAAVCILGWIDLSVCAAFLAAAVCHELGHLVAFLVCGVRIVQIRFSAGGAVIRTGCCSCGQELLCAAAGPVASFVLALAVCRWVPVLFAVSMLLGCVNLLPVYPLDGGRILRCVLSAFLSENRVYGILRGVTFAVCSVLMVAACWITVEKQAGLWPIFASLVILCRVGKAGWTEKPVAFPL